MIKKSLCILAAIASIEKIVASNGEEVFIGRRSDINVIRLKEGEEVVVREDDNGKLSFSSEPISSSSNATHGSSPSQGSSGVTHSGTTPQSTGAPSGAIPVYAPTRDEVSQSIATHAAANPMQGAPIITGEQYNAQSQGQGHAPAGFAAFVPGATNPDTTGSTATAAKGADGKSGSTATKDGEKKDGKKDGKKDSDKDKNGAANKKGKKNGIRSYAVVVATALAMVFTVVV